MANLEDQNSSTQIKLISKCFVKPKYEVEASKHPYNLGIADIGFLRLDPIQKGLLFSTNPEIVRSHFLSKLKDSLEISLVHFYPLAGRFSTIDLPDDDAKWIYLDCTKGPGAQLIHATVDCTVSSILSSIDVLPIVRSFFDLGEISTNYDGHTRPLLSVQVTELIDGVFMGFSLNHSVVDGTSLWHFINSLFEIFVQFSQSHGNDHHSISISQKPVFKPYFPDGLIPGLKLPNTIFNILATPRNKHEVLRERIFHFSSRSISTLKAKANSECGTNNISSFQALSGFMWRSITRARNLEPELETCCALIINARPRFCPPLSDAYIGNFITRDQSICKVGEILNNGLGWASMLVHQVVVSVDDKRVREFYETVVKIICGAVNVKNEARVNNPFYSPNLVMIGGSSRFDVFQPEFGFGKAKTVLAGYCNKEDGKITASPGREGRGSVDLEVCLRPEFMNALETDHDFMSFVTLV